MAFYHSITVLQIWAGLLLLCSSMHWSSSSWTLSHTNTHHARQLASWKIYTHPS